MFPENSDLETESYKDKRKCVHRMRAGEEVVVALSVVRPFLCDVSFRLSCAALAYSFLGG